MASRAEHKRWVRQLVQIQRGFELYDDTPRAPPKFIWDFGIDFGPTVRAIRSVKSAFQQLADKMRAMSQTAKKATYVRRERPVYPRPVPLGRPTAKPACRPGAFRLPRGGGRWSSRS